MNFFSLTLCIVMAIGLVGLPLAHSIKVSDLISKWENRVDQERVEASKLNTKREPATPPVTSLRAKLVGGTKESVEIDKPVVAIPVVATTENSVPATVEQPERLVEEPERSSTHDESPTEMWDSDEPVLPNYVSDDDHEDHIEEHVADQQ